MQWVVTTGRTVEEARERALDALGIDDADLEFEVLDEPRSTLLGLRRTDARIRARVRPTRPRPKIDRRNRRKAPSSAGRRRRSKRGSERTDEQSDATTEAESTPAAPPPSASGGAGGPGGGRSRRRKGRGQGGASPEGPSEAEAAAPASGARSPGTPEPAGTTPSQVQPLVEPTPRSASTESAPHTFPDTDETPPGATGDSMTDISLDEQEPSAVGFVQGLVDAFGVEATVESHAVDEEHLEVAVTGPDLGLLVGPRGSTLNAIQELTRTAVAQQHSGRLQGRLRVDIAGYRARRKEALERFAAQQAERVKETGTPVALEPMSPPDRKIVHDAVNDIAGVRTTSEGEDRRRHVVILPE